jgi:hypothetical protein
MDSSFDADGPKDARPEDKISDFEAYVLGKTLLSRIKQETSSLQLWQSYPERDPVTTRFQSDRVVG